MIVEAIEKSSVPETTRSTLVSGHEFNGPISLKKIRNGIKSKDYYQCCI